MSNQSLTLKKRTAAPPKVHADILASKTYKAATWTLEKNGTAVGILIQSGGLWDVWDTQARNRIVNRSFPNRKEAFDRAVIALNA